MPRKRIARVRKKQGGFHKLEFKSKEDFVKEYDKYDESSARNFYLQVLSELERSVAIGNINNLKYLSNTVDNISSVEDQTKLKTFHEDTGNPLLNTNLIILACKHNQPNILKYLLSNDNILKNLSIHKGSGILPDDDDETSHNAFYYAIRSGNVELLEILISRTVSFYNSDLDKLDEILSKAYEELKLKNVLLTDKMEFEVENKLLNLRFFSDNIGKKQNITSNLDNIKKRVDLVLENVNLLVIHSDSDVDEMFLFIVKFIAQNIQVLKRQLKITYDRLPWEEIEFCLICFVSLHTKKQEINLFYHATLDKRKVLQYLEKFSKKLEEVKETIEGMSIDKLTSIPNLNRETVVAEIIRNNRQFEELYKDYRQIRDIYSLEKIGSYINLASSVNPGDREGQLVITRVLQIIGEHLKNTLESPKLSTFTSDLILLKLSKNTRKVITDLRNSLSHASSLIKRTKIEENSDIKFYSGVQCDLTEVGEIIIDILYDNKIKMIKILLNKIIHSENVEEIAEVCKAFKNAEVDDMVSHDYRILKHEMFDNITTLQNIKRNEIDLANFTTTKHEKLEKLIKILKKLITDKTDFEKTLFSKIDDIIDVANRKFETIRDNYLRRFIMLKTLQHFLNDKIDDSIIKGIKFRAKETLKNMSPQIEPHSLEKIAELSEKIFHSVRSRKINENLDEINAILYEIFYATEFKTDDLKWIEEFRSKLNEKCSISKKKQKATYPTKEENSAQLALKLSELKTIFRNNSLSAKKVRTYKDDKKIQAVIEMLLLDIMSILSISNYYLGNNLYYLDGNFPLLVGKCLRNHLAHNNTLFDILLPNPATAIILNAKKFTEDGIITTKKKIGKIIIDNPLKLEEKHNQGLKIITRQREMYAALEEGNLECLKECLKKGADINARNINLWTALHYAAKGPSLEVVKFILEKNVSVNFEEENGQNPLHIAAAYGNANIVEYLVERTGLSVNKEDHNLKTPLHIAAQNGHKGTVEVLLKFNADSAEKDANGLSALHYAIRNNHFHIVKILLKTGVNVDVNEIAGGFTPLHEASEFGHLEVVTYLIQKRADVNAKNDKNWTPLHAAAFEGHLDVTKALILEGADVNARVIDGCTPLHYALENGHEEIASILLSHGAKVNISDKTYKNTPLHYAARFGHGDTIKSLLKYGADATVTTIEAITPLHFAAGKGHLEIIIALLKQNVDINAKDIINATALYYAANNGQEEAAALLIKNGATIDVKDDNYFTPLYVAVLNNHQDVANLLIQNKANVNEKDKKGSTILHAAAVNGCKDVIDVLIQHKAEVNARNNYGFTPLHIASAHGYEDVVVLLLENKAEVNAISFDGFTPLLNAIIGGHKYIVKLLIKNKSNINAKTFRGETPLCLAIEAGQKEITEILIMNGADVNGKSGDGFTTPLLIAVKYNRKEIVKVLLDNGAIVDDKDDGPLPVAVMAGYRDIVEILIKNKFRIDTVDVKNVTLLHLAATRGQIDIVKMLMKKGADVNAKTLDNVTPLHLAAQEDHGEIAEYLIANGAKINAKSEEGTTPLHNAVAPGHGSVIKVLLDNQADVTLKDNKNRTPLELAVGNGNLQIIKMLLQYKRVNINAKGNADWTLLHIAAQGNNLKLVKYLINEGADINSRNASGSKPIHIAARDGFKDAVVYFLSNGCSINDLGACNQTLLHYAVMKNNLEIVTYLIEKGADVNVRDANGFAPIHIAVKLDYISAVKMLLKNGAAYDIADNLGRKPLDMATGRDIFDYLLSTEKFFEAVKINNFLKVKKYIIAGVLVDVKNIDGVTPLYFAAWKGYEEVLDDLLENNANPNTVNAKGITPLHYAAKFSHLKVVKALLSCGAIFSVVSHKGKTPLDFSTDRNIVSLFKLISGSFKSVTKGSSRVIYDINKIKDIDTIKAIMNACNREGETLIVAAMRCNFPKVEELKNILQDDVSEAVNRALMLVGHGNYQNAISIFNKVYEKRKYILGPNNPGTLEIERNIAVILYKQGNYREALDKLERIYQKQKKTMGLRNKKTLKTRSAFALVLYRQDRNEEALEIFQEVYKMQKEIVGPNHPDTSDTQFHMASVLAALGKHEEALNINKRIYEEHKRKLGANHPATIAAQNNIAFVLLEQRNYEQSLEIYRDVLEKKKIILGVYHTDTLRTLQSIAFILSRQKKYREAFEAHQEVISIQKIVLGPNNPETLVTLANLGSLLLAQSKLVNAFKIYTECFEKVKSVLGPSSAMALKISQKLKEIKFRFQFEGCEASEILSYLQDDMKIAIMNGDIQTVLSLLKEGTDVNEKDSDGITLLHYAVSYEHEDIVNILLQNGADIFQVTNKGNTPLHIAVSKNNSKIVKVLVQHVQRNKLSDFINAKTTFGNTTALFVATEKGSLNIVKILLKNGAIYDIENNEGKKPQSISTNQSVTNLLEQIEELFKDAKSGNEEIIRKMKSMKRDEFIAAVNARNNQGNTLLQVLISRKHTKIANELSAMLKKIVI